MNKLCECGCGKEVLSNKCRFLKGHHLKVWNKNLDFKKKQTTGMIEKYGVEHAMCSPEIQENYKQSCLKNLGVENPNQSEIIKEKKKQTNLKHIGVENPSQSIIIQEKKKQTNFKRSGFNYPLQFKESFKKYNNTCQKRYGVDTVFESKHVQEKFKSNFLKKYGVENPFQLKTIIESNKIKSKQTCKEKYGFDNWAKTQQGKQLHRINAIKRIENQKLNGEPLMPNIGFNERECLNKLEKIFGIKIIRNNHCFAYKIGRIPDGHPEKYLKVVILFDEEHHFLNKECTIYNENSIQETKDYESIGLTVFRISQLIWIKDPEVIVKQFQSLLDLLKSNPV
jgi:hypothetical protein